MVLAGAIFTNTNLPAAGTYNRQVNTSNALTGEDEAGRPTHPDAQLARVKWQQAKSFVANLCTSQC